MPPPDNELAAVVAVLKSIEIEGHHFDDDAALALAQRIVKVAADARGDATLPRIRASE